jgi:hypothetical protein
MAMSTAAVTLHARMSPNVSLDTVVRGQLDTVTRRWHSTLPLVYQGVPFWPYLDRLATHFAQLRHLSYLAYWPKYDVFVASVAPSLLPVATRLDESDKKKKNEQEEYTQHQAYIYALNLKAPARADRLVELRHMNTFYKRGKGLCFFDTGPNGVYRHQQEAMRLKKKTLQWVVLYCCVPRE